MSSNGDTRRRAQSKERHVPIQQQETSQKGLKHSKKELSQRQEFYSKFEKQLQPSSEFGNFSKLRQPSIRERLELEIANLQRQIKEVKAQDLCETSQGLNKTQNNNRKNLVKETSTAETNLDKLFKANQNLQKKMSDPNQTTPLSTTSGDPLPHPLAGFGTNRATTTERRTTTTTTTKRTIKSSDDFLPGATEIQQVRSESRSGSVSSERPLYGQTQTSTTAGSTTATSK